MVSFEHNCFIKAPINANDVHIVKTFYKELKKKNFFTLNKNRTTGSCTFLASTTLA